MHGPQTDEDIREAIEHRDVLMELMSILSTTSGQKFIRYLFKHFDVGGLPPLGLEGTILFDQLGFLRAGKSIFDLVSEANPQLAGTILAEIKKEQYDDRIRSRDQ